jgi:hypothetical protein
VKNSTAGLTRVIVDEQTKQAINLIASMFQFPIRKKEALTDAHAALLREGFRVSNLQSLVNMVDNGDVDPAEHNGWTRSEFILWYLKGASVDALEIADGACLDRVHSTRPARAATTALQNPPQDDKREAAEPRASAERRKTSILEGRIQSAAKVRLLIDACEADWMRDEHDVRSSRRTALQALVNASDSGLDAGLLNAAERILSEWRTEMAVSAGLHAAIEMGDTAALESTVKYAHELAPLRGSQKLLDAAAVLGEFHLRDHVRKSLGIFIDGTSTGGIKLIEAVDEMVKKDGSVSKLVQLFSHVQSGDAGEKIKPMIRFDVQPVAEASKTRSEKVRVIRAFDRSRSCAVSDHTVYWVIYNAQPSSTCMSPPTAELPAPLTLQRRLLVDTEAQTDELCAATTRSSSLSNHGRRAEGFFHDDVRLDASVQTDAYNWLCSHCARGGASMGMDAFSNSVPPSPASEAADESPAPKTAKIRRRSFGVRVVSPRIKFASSASPRGVNGSGARKRAGKEQPKARQSSSAATNPSVDRLYPPPRPPSLATVHSPPPDAAAVLSQKSRDMGARHGVWGPAPPKREPSNICSKQATYDVASRLYEPTQASLSRVRAIQRHRNPKLRGTTDAPDFYVGQERSDFKSPPRVCAGEQSMGFLSNTERFTASDYRSQTPPLGHYDTTTPRTWKERAGQPAKFSPSPLHGHLDTVSMGSLPDLRTPTLFAACLPQGPIMHHACLPSRVAASSSEYLCPVQADTRCAMTTKKVDRSTRCL